MNAATAAYAGPAYFLVSATDDRSFDVTDRQGERIATYPSADLAHKVRKDFDAKALREYLKAQKKGVG